MTEMDQEEAILGLSGLQDGGVRIYEDRLICKRSETVTVSV